jgi:flagellar hook-basal body complex protein FliE
MNPVLATRAYAAIQNSAGITENGASAPAGASGFAQLLQGVMGDAVSASRHAETQMIANVEGRAELVDVVTAVASAEASLETVMAVRDQVIQAYQEIMRMPI